MTERTRFPLWIERCEAASDWCRVGWTCCGEHPAMPGFVVLEWRQGGEPVAPFYGRHDTSERGHIERANAALGGEAA